MVTQQRGHEVYSLHMNVKHGGFYNMRAGRRSTDAKNHKKLPQTLESHHRDTWGQVEAE